MEAGHVVFLHITVCRLLRDLLTWAKYCHACGSFLYYLYYPARAHYCFTAVSHSPDTPVSEKYSILNQVLSHLHILNLSRSACFHDPVNLRLTSQTERSFSVDGHRTLVSGLKKHETWRPDLWDIVIQHSCDTLHITTLHWPCHAHTTGETGEVQISHYKCTNNSREQPPSKGSLSAQGCPRLGGLLAGVLCSQLCSERCRVSRKVPCSSWNCCICSTAQMCIMASICPLQENVTHKWPLNLLLNPIWLSHVASAFSHTATNTRTASPCSVVSAGISTRWRSACRLAAAWESQRASEDREVMECVNGSPRPWLPWPSDHLMRAPKAVQSRSRAVHWRYRPPMLLCTFQKGRKTAQGNVDTVI